MYKRKRKCIKEYVPMELPKADVRITLKEDSIKIVIDGQVVEQFAIPKRASVRLTYPINEMQSVESGDRFVFMEWSK